MTRTILFLTAVVAVLSTLALAEVDPHAGHDMAAMSPMGEGAGTPAAMAYAAANAAMHEAMNIPYSGNPDADFIRGMIPHHQGAVEMAQIVLQYGTDPEVRALAEGIIAAQEAEIAWMQDWLAANGQ